MSTRIAHIVRDPASGDGVASQTVSIKKVAGGTVDSVATDSDGLASFTVTEIGDPGPSFAEFDDGSGNTKRRSGEVIGQVGGFLWVDAINDAFKALGEGRVVAGAGNELECTADGSTMNISVDTGVAILKDGYVYVREASGTIAIGAAHASLGRVDTIVLRLSREGETDRGTVTLAVVAGVAAVTPIATSLTQDASTWETALANVTVDGGVTAIAVGKVASARAFTFTPPTNSQAGGIFYIAADNKFTMLPKSTNGHLLSLASGLPAWVAPSSSGISGITVQEGDSTLDADITTLDFDAGDFSITESPENEANIRIEDHSIQRMFFDDTLNDNTSSVTFETQVSGTITIPSTGTWTIQAAGMGRIASSDGGNVWVRVTVDGTTSDTSRSGPTLGAYPIQILGTKTGVTSGTKTITLSYRGVGGNTAYFSNGLLIVNAYRTS